MKPSFSFRWSPHRSIFPHACSNSPALSRYKSKNILYTDPLQRNFKVKSFALDLVRTTLSHSVLPITTSDRFPDGELAETLDFAEQRSSNPDMSSSTKSFQTNNGFLFEYIQYSTLIWEEWLRTTVLQCRHTSEHGYYILSEFPFACYKPFVSYGILVTFLHEPIRSHKTS